MHESDKSYGKVIKRIRLTARCYDKLLENFQKRKSEFALFFAMR